MKSTINLRVYENNNIVKRWQDKTTKKCFSQTKRVGKNFPLSSEERKIFVSKGTVGLIRYFRDKDPSLSLRECLDKVHEIIINYDN